MVFVGNDFPLLSRSQTGGWVSVTVPLMLEYRYDGATPAHPELFRRNLVVEAAFAIHVGERVLGAFGGFLNRLQVYALFDQNLTPHRSSDAGSIDRFNPVAQYGITIPFGNWGP